MASEKRLTLQDGQLLATTNGSTFDLPLKTRDLIGHLNVTAINGATTLDVKLQHSPDGTLWYDLGSAFAQLVGVTGDETVRITVSTFEFVRMAATLAGATQDATLTVKLYHDDQ